MSRGFSRRLAGARLSVLCQVLLVAGGLACSKANPGKAASKAALSFPATRTYTTSADFALGTMTGVDTSVPDQIQLTAGGSPLAFIWVPNNDHTISKIDTVSGKELGRYYVSNYYDPNPSRTTVDLQGNCWVANRRAGTVVQIGLEEAGQCVDRNGDGIIQTSRDGGDGIISPDEMLPWGSDECVLYEVVVIPGWEGAYSPPLMYAGPFPGESGAPIPDYMYQGGFGYDPYWYPGPRGLAVDQSNNLWIGSFGTQKYQYFNTSTGQIERSVDVSLAPSPDGYVLGAHPTTTWSWEPRGGHTPYGATADRNGVIWSSGLYSGTVVWIDPNHPDATGNPSIGYVFTGFVNYGMGLDHIDHLFVADLVSSAVAKINVGSKTIEPGWPKYYDSIGSGRGVACTSDNDVWVASNSGWYYQQSVTRLANDGVRKAVVVTYGTPTGVAVDAAGKVWVTRSDTPVIQRIDPTINGIDLETNVVGTGGHYSYSDMTGSVSRTITTRSGSWTANVDGGATGTSWTSVSWNGDVPAGAAITVRVRSSDSETGPWSSWVVATSGSALATVTGRYLEVEATLQGAPGAESPRLYDVTVNAAGTVSGPPTASIVSPDQDLTAPYGSSLTFQGSEAPFSTYEWFSNGNRISTKSAFTTSALPLGTNVITYRVTDWAGQTAEDHRTVTVVDSTPRVDLAIEGGDLTFWAADGTQVTNPSSGDTIDIKATVHNLSLIASAAPLTVRFLDADGASETLLGTATTPQPIPELGVATVTLRWTIPSTISAGYHVIRAKVTADPYESYVDNNETTHLLVIGTLDTRRAWISVDPVFAPGSVSAGSPFGTGGSAFYRMAPEWNSPLPVMGANVRMSFVELPAGPVWQGVTTAGGSFGINVVAPTTPGTYTLRVQVSDGTLSASRDIGITVPQPTGPDLVVAAIGAQNGVAGQSETVVAQICNVGQTDFSSGFANHLEISYEGSADVLFSNDASLTALAASACTWVTFAPWSWPAGERSYRLKVVANSGGIPGEDTSNDTLSVSTYVYPAAVDLQAIALTQSCDTITATVRNHGGFAASGGTVQCLADGQVYSTVTLPPLGGKDAATTVVCGRYGPTGPHIFTVQALGTETDQHPADNAISATFSIGGADLAVVGVSVNGSGNIVYLAQTNTLQADVRNLGCTSGSGTVQFYVSGTPIGQPVPVSLAAGAIASPQPTVTQLFDLPPWTAATSYQLTAKVVPDGADAVTGNDLRTESLWIYPAQPDYQVLSSGITVTPNPVAPGDPVRIRAQVCNVGSQLGTGFNVAFYDEGKVQIGATQTFGQTVTAGQCIPDIMPRSGDGSGSEVTWTFTTGGNHAVLVVVSAIAGNEHDLNANNNQASATVNVTNALPDLVVTAVSKDIDRAKPGDSITVTTTVKNQGVATGAPVSVGLYLTSGSGTRIKVGSTAQIAQLAPGQSQTQSTVITVPSGLPAGTSFQATAIADDASVVGEGNETNNVTNDPRALTITRPDLVVSSVKASPSTATRGVTPVTFTIAVANQGALASAPFTAGIYLSTDSAITTSDVLVGTASFTSVAAGNNQSQKVTLTIPTGVPAGTYTFGAIADPPGAAPSYGVVDESNETNNAKAGTTLTVN